MNSLPKLLIIGADGVGKDTVASLLCEHYGFESEPASLIFVREELMQQESISSQYANYYDCWEKLRSTDENRLKLVEWIDKFNSEDPARLAKLVLASCNIYTGIRRKREFISAIDLFDLVIWVDASVRVGTHAAKLELTSKDADLIITNNGDIKELTQRVKRLYAQIMQKLNAPSEDEAKLLEALNKPLTNKKAKKPEVKDSENNSEDNSDY